MKIFSLIASIGLLSVVYTEGSSVTITTSGTTFSKGQNLEVKCYLVAGVQGRTVSETTDWKVDGSSTYSIQKKQGNTNGWLDMNVKASSAGVFQNDPRITSVYDFSDNNTHVFSNTVLTVSGLNASDSGSYRCQFKSTEDNTAESEEITVNVKTQPTDLKFEMTSSDNDTLTELETKGAMKTYDLDMKDRVNLTCTAYGGEPHPKVNIKLGDKIVSDSSVTESKWEGEPGYMLKKTTVVSTAMEPDLSSLKGRKLVCETIYDNMVLFQSNINIRFRIPPLITCSPTTVTAAVGTNVKLTCTVKGIGSNDTIKWEIDDGKRLEFLEDGHNFSGRFKVKTTKVGEHMTYSSSMTIDGLKPNDFNYENGGQRYTLRASNRFGTSSMEVNVLKKAATGEIGASSNTLPNMPMVISCIAALLMFTRY